MRIAHLISSGGFFGAENVLLNLAQWFHQNGETVFVGTLKDSRNPKLQVVDRAKELNLSTFVIDCNGRFDLGAVLKLKKFIRGHKIEILHTHNYKSDVIGLLAAKLSGIPIVATAHGFTQVSKTVSLYEKIDRWILKNFFQAVVVVSNSVLPDFHSPKKMVIGNGIDLSRFKLDKSAGKDFRKKYGISDSEKVIGIIGRLSVEKNQELFIHAAHDVLKKQGNVKFVIIGDGPEEAKLKSLVMAYGLQKQIIFTGVIENVAPVYQTLDIFTLTSKTEGVPMTILEAMASSVPVVVSKVGGIPQIVFHRDTGLIFEKDNQDALVEQWSLILQQPDLVQQMKTRALEYVTQEFSQAVMAERYLDCYRKVLF